MAVCPSAEFYSGQAARLLIGQKNFTAQSPGNLQEDKETVTPDAATLGGVGGLAFANNTLFVADANRVSSTPLNHRVLIYRNADRITLPVDAPVPQFTRCPACRGVANVVLGQTDFTKNELKTTPTQASLRRPTAVASDGVRLVVADTDNNRVLIWNTIPASNNQQADLVLGQENFTSMLAPRGAPGQKMRGPQGVWIQGQRLFVADSGNHRVLIWNSFPNRSFQSADVVIGQPDFNTTVELDLTRTNIDPKDNNLLNPVSVTSDGQRMYVADLGQNRVLIWNSIPTRNQQSADLVLGQKDFTSGVANNSAKLCASNGKDADGKATYPTLCSATMDFPRYALSDGKYLFVADGGNDRVMVYTKLPTENGQKADVILGQLNGDVNRSSDSAFPLYRSSSDLLRTPVSLAWDGVNLFVSDTFNRRIVVFSLHDQPLNYTAVRNLASRDVFASASITLGGTLTENNQITISVAGRDYVYKLIKDDTFANILQQLATRINSDAEGKVTVSIIPDLRALLLTSRAGGEEGNKIEFTTKTSENATITLTTSGATLAGGQNAAQVAPGTLVTILGDNLADRTEAAPENATELPRTLAGVTVYFDGMEAPLLLVAPDQINAQLPWEFQDASSANAYVRIERRTGRVDTTAPVAVPIIPQNPGIFAYEGLDPRPGMLAHFSDRATGTVSVDGTANKGDKAIVTIEDREYSYEVKEGDDLARIRDGLIALINANPDEKVEAFAAGVFTRIRLRAKIAGEEGNGLAYGARSSDGAQVIMTPTLPALCCANVAGSMITPENPAQPGETIVVYATGLGTLKERAAIEAIKTGIVYAGPAQNEPSEFVSSLAGGKTANVLYAALKPGAIGVYEIHLELNSDLPTNLFTQVTIAQDIYVSNVVTFPLRNPKEPTTP
jgi:hypothetical protein